MFNFQAVTKKHKYSNTVSINVLKISKEKSITGTYPLKLILLQNITEIENTLRESEKDKSKLTPNTDN